MIRFFLVFLSAFFLAVPMLAQEAIDNKSETSEPITAAFAISEIADAAAATDDALRQSEELAADSIKLQNFEDNLDEIKSQYRDTISDAIKIDLDALSLWQLKNEKSTWEAHQQKLELFNEAFRKYESSVYQKQDDLLNLKTRWEKTLEAADTTDAVQAVKTTISTNIRQIDNVRLIMNAHIEKVVALSNEASAELSSVKTILQEISNNRSKRGDQLLAPDAAPFFKAAKDEYGVSLVQAISKSAQESKQVLSRFLKDNAWRAFLHLLSFFMFLLLMRRVRKEFMRSEWRGNEEYEMTERILQVPIVNALILWLISVSLFYKNTPSVFIDALVLPSLIPIVVLLPRIFKIKLLRFFLFLAALVFLDKIIGQLFTSGYYLRSLVMLQNIIMLTGLLLFLHPKSKLKIALKQKKRRGLLWLFNVFVLLTAFALYCNLAGIFQLSVLITRGTVHSFSIGIIVFLSVRLIQIITIFFLNLGKNLPINFLSKYHDSLVKWSKMIILILGIWLWLRSSLRGFALLIPVSEWLTEFANHSWQFGELTMSVQNLIDFVSILVLFVVLANVLQILLREELLKRLDLRKGVPLAIAVLTRYVILFFGFLLAMSSAGISMDKLSLLVGALGVGIGFGLQNIVSNFVSGLVIIFERPIHIGDVVSTTSMEGEVTDIGLRSSRIRTWDGAEVVVPNNDLIGKEVTNWTFSDAHRRMERIVLIESGPSPREVKEIIDKVMQAQDGLLPFPRPQAYFLGFENSALKFRLLLWLEDGLLETPSELLMNLHEALHEKGFEAYMPIQKIRMEPPTENNPEENTSETENKD